MSDSNVISEYRFSVKDLAEFCWRKGDYRFSDQSLKPTAKQGQAVHRFLQERHHQQDDSYQSEVSVADECIRLADTLPYRLKVSGRIDSLWQTDKRLTLEEIKTTYCQDSELPEDQFQVHLAQARLYGALLLKDKTTEVDEVMVTVTYWHLSGEHSYQRQQKETPASLLNFLECTLTDFGDWLDKVHQHRCARQAFLHQLRFPFSDYRSGQKALAGACYHQGKSGESILIHAATGIGKSVSSLFGSLKAMGDEYGDQIWYLTAKTSGQQAALTAVKQIQQQGKDIKCLNLSSQQRTCFCHRDADSDEALDTPCQWETGFYDRRRGAMEALFSAPLIDREYLQKIAREHRVCPHHLAQELLPWVDIVIADFNYLFGFTVRNQTYLERHQRRINLLVDEAHNLPSRCRDNFSAKLDREELREIQKTLKQKMHPARSAINAVIKAARTLDNMEEYPAALFDAIQQAKSALDTPDEQQTELFAPDDVLNLKIQLNQWLRLARYCESGLGEQQGKPFSLKNNNSTLQLTCNNPEVVISDLSQRCRSRVFFSGSLLPPPYFQTQLCQEAPHLNLPSPFPAERLQILLGPLAMGYQHRAAAVPEALRYIRTLYDQQPGLYLVCAPSYEFLTQLKNLAEAQFEDIPVIFQSDVSEQETLSRMTSGIAFIVLGGSFAEGVEWPPGILKGVVIMGNGMPGPTLEQKRLQRYFEHAPELSGEQSGFDYAFLYPGLNRIIQTAGRIQRTEKDAGVVLLLDKRFRQQRYRQNLPEHWRYQTVDSPTQLTDRCLRFWGSLSECEI